MPMELPGDRSQVVTDVLTATSISLEVDHGDECAEVARPLLLQLSNGYEECAVQEIPLFIDFWRDQHRTARKRADRAYRRGYSFNPFVKHRRVDEIHRINMSASHRQGRPMTAGYRERPSDSPLPAYPCPRHRLTFDGVEDRAGELAADLALYRAGELALVSQIWGHAKMLEDEIMYLLVQGVLEREREQGGYLVYNRWNSGTEGLMFFKERLGFERTLVEWLP